MSKKKGGSNKAKAYNPNRLLKKQKPMIGVDIGSKNIKIVETKSNFDIKSTVFEPIPSGIINQGRIEAEGPLADLIKKTLAKGKIKGSNCALCLSNSELIVRELVLPEMDDKQILENINFEIISFLPLKNLDYIIDYKITEYIQTPGDAPNQLRLMVVATQKNLIQTYINTLKQAGLKVQYVDVFPNAMSKLNRWSNLYNNKKIDNNVCFIDFGARYTNVLILKKGEYFTQKTINKGGDNINQLIMDKLKVDLTEANDIKHRTNFFADDTVEVNKSIKTYYEYLASDIDKVIGFFRNRHRDQEIENIYISGGASLLMGLEEYLNRQFSIKVSSISSMRFNKKQASKEHDAIFSQALGVAVREEW